MEVRGEGGSYEVELKSGWEAFWTSDIPNLPQMYWQVFTRSKGLYLYLQVFAKFAEASKYLQKLFAQRAKTSFYKYLQILF